MNSTEFAEISQEIELGEPEERYSAVYEYGNWGVSRHYTNIEIL
jgi:hypothetical protein